MQAACTWPRRPETYEKETSQHLLVHQALQALLLASVAVAEEKYLHPKRQRQSALQPKDEPSGTLRKWQSLSRFTVLLEHNLSPTHHFSVARSDILDRKFGTFVAWTRLSLISIVFEKNMPAYF